jgi:hypothetical protein
MGYHSQERIAMKPQTLVRRKDDGRIGIICPTIYLLRQDGDHPLSVCYDENYPVTLNCEGGEEAFEVVGPENAVPDPTRCGAGQGEHCCRFLVVGADGFRCERFGELRYSLQFKTMTAQREPTRLYPECFLVKNPETVEVPAMG